MFSELKSIKIGFNKAACWKMSIALCLAFVATILPDVAMAAKTSVDNTMCKIVNVMTGRVGQAIGSIAVVFLGIGLFMGKMSWSVALAIALGVAAIFGAGVIVNFLADGTPGGQC
ncbi:MAG: TrbC/VirB2 family protein [Rickettsiales bacterium]|nr:TrbC/VirB2 family protein [Rickettsiales bacterium]